MEYLESDQQSLEDNNVKEILNMVPNEDGDQQYMFGSDVEESVHCEQDDDDQSPKEYDSDIQNPTGNGDEGECYLIPRVGMRFSTEDEGYNFYNAYAANIGFSVRRGSIRHNQKGDIRHRTIVCSKKGLKLDSGPLEIEKSNKLETRTDCKACIRFSLLDGMWEVTRFDPDHNHDLAEPGLRQYSRSARKLFDAIPNASNGSPVDEVIRVPTIGMKVYSENEAYNLYNLYATHIGFSIRKKDYRFNSRGVLRQRNYVCSKQGLRVDKEPDKVKKVNRLETRTDCKAGIRFTITAGAWEVTFFNPEHNHELVEPAQRKYLRSIRRVSPTKASLVTSTKTQPCLTEKVRGSSNASFLPGECQNTLQTMSSCIIQAEDTQSVINRLKRKQAEDAMFFYSMQVDSHSHLANFFWRDGRSRLDYDYFGDVVVFDTSFRTIKYDLVCAPFVGVNHHGKDVLFGCAILSDESVSSFSWLFETFLESMSDRHPKTIFTNQSQALANAVERVLARTSHCLCIRNIQQKTAQNLPNLYSNPDFKARFEKCLYGCNTEMEFQSTWDELIKGQTENEWLNGLYDLRLKWCPTFSLDTFCANVRSNQRTDTTRNVFNHMSCRTLNLAQLVDQYEQSAEWMRSAELDEDLRCNHDSPTRASRNSAILKQAAGVYTIETFKLFQEEMVESLSIVMNELSSDGRLHTYELIEEGQDRGYTVHFNADNCTATCSCKMFESMGLLCRHALRVLNMKHVTKLPARYILKRWTKRARKGISVPENGDSSSCSANSTRLLIRSRLMHKAFCAVDKSLQTAKGSDIADSLMDQMIEQAEREINAALYIKDVDNGDNESNSDSATNDTVVTPCSFDSSPAFDTTHSRLKGQLQKKRKRKESKSNLSSGQQKQQNFVDPPGVLFHSQFPTFLHPSFHPSVVGMNGIPYALHQGPAPTWVLGNIRPASVLPGTFQMHQANQDSSKSSNANT